MPTTVFRAASSRGALVSYFCTLPTESGQARSDWVRELLSPLTEARG